jgi:hypothetical protein
VGQNHLKLSKGAKAGFSARVITQADLSSTGLRSQDFNAVIAELAKFRKIAKRHDEYDLFLGRD